jgi:hypothetical protein
VRSKNVAHSFCMTGGIYGPTGYLYAYCVKPAVPVSAVSVTTEAWQTLANATHAARQLTSSVPACPVDYHPVLIAKPTYGLTGSALTVVDN